jgi:hypothetical protein
MAIDAGGKDIYVGNKPPKPPKGWTWVIIDHNDSGENVWRLRQGDGPKVDSGGDGGSSGGSSGGGYGSYGGGGGGASEGLSQYIQWYRLNIIRGGSPPKDLLSKAKAGNWSIAYFAQQVRAKDPAYMRSMEAKSLLLGENGFNAIMKALFPGLSKRPDLMKSPFFKNQAKWYLRNGIAFVPGGRSAAQAVLFERLTNTKRWKQNNPYWRDYQRNQNIGVQTVANPILYKQYLEGLGTAFKEYGMELPDDFKRAFFRSRYAAKQNFSGLADNLKQLSQQGGSMAWMEGDALARGEQKQLLFGGKQQADLRQRLAKAFTIKGSFLSADQKGPESNLNQQQRLVQPLI